MYHAPKHLAQLARFAARVALSGDNALARCIDDGVWAGKVLADIGCPQIFLAEGVNRGNKRGRVVRKAVVGRTRYLGIGQRVSPAARPLVLAGLLAQRERAKNAVSAVTPHGAPPLLFARPLPCAPFPECSLTRCRTRAFLCRRPLWRRHAEGRRVAGEQLPYRTQGATPKEASQEQNWTTHG